MTNPYGIKGAPAVGRGVPGLPRRRAKSGVKTPIAADVRGEMFFAASRKRAYHAFIVPAGVYSICAIGIAGGGGALMSSWVGAGGGGALAWSNNIPVYPGQRLYVFVGNGGIGDTLKINTDPATLNHGGDTFIMDVETGTILLHAEGGRTGYYTYNTNSALSRGTGGIGGRKLVGQGGGNGGTGAGYYTNSQSPMGSGGAAGGYNGNGPNGVAAITAQTSIIITEGNVGVSGSGGTGGVRSSSAGTGSQGEVGGTGGTGPWGLGSNGGRGYIDFANLHGKGGSNGEDGYWTGPQYAILQGTPGLYGAGASSGIGSGPGIGAAGCARILWGAGRAFPSTDVGQT